MEITARIQATEDVISDQNEDAGDLMRNGCATEYILAIKLKGYANRLDTKCDRGVPNDSKTFGQAIGNPVTKRGKK